MVNLESKRKRPVRWGMIGCGAVTEVKSAPAYQKTDGFELAAVMRRDEALARDYAARHQVETWYTDADELIFDEKIDAVYIATPPDTHKLYGLRVAESGKPCCIEKPLSPRVADSQEIVETFESAGVPLFVAYYRRSLPRFNQVKELLDGGAIGVVRHVGWHLTKPASPLDQSGQYNWRTDREIAPGGYFDDLACHGLDLFAYLFGEFETVRGVGLNQQGLYSAYDAVTACWSHKNGVTGAGSWNFGACARQDRVEVRGSQGAILFSVFDEEPVVVQTPDRRQEFPIENPENIQLYHVQNMRDALLQGGAHPSTGATALHTSWVMDQIVSSGS